MAHNLTDTGSLATYPATAEWYLHVARNVRVYVTPFLLFGGCIGNALCCIVLQSKYFRGSRTSILLTSLAVVDTLVLLTNLLDLWLASLLYAHPNALSFLRNQGHAGCVTGVFFTYFFSHLASWVLVLVNLDRLATVTAPSWAKHLSQPRSHAIALALLTGVLFAFDLHVVFMVEPYDYGTNSLPSAPGVYENATWYENATTNNTPLSSLDPYSNATSHQICAIREEHADGFYPKFLLWSDFVLLSLVPFALIALCNGVILVYLLRGARRRRSSNRSGTTTPRSSKLHRTPSSVTVMLVVVSLTFLVTTTPLVLYYILHAQIVAANQGDPVGLAVAVGLVGDSVLVLLCYSNNAINFALYCLCGSRFRHALSQLLRDTFPVPQRQTSSRSSSRGNNVTTV